MRGLLRIREFLPDSVPSRFVLVDKFSGDPIDLDATIGVAGDQGRPNVSHVILFSGDAEAIPFLKNWLGVGHGAKLIGAGRLTGKPMAVAQFVLQVKLGIRVVGDPDRSGRNALGAANCYEQ